MGKFCIKLSSLFIVCLLSACSGDSDRKEPKIINQAPTAQIIMNLPSITLGDAVTLNGVTSNDLDGDSLTYLWRVENQDGEEYLLDNNTLESFVFIPENFGTYTVALTVNDGKLNSDTITSEIIVEPNEHSFPIAATNDDVNDKIGRIVWLSAEKSRAADGELLSYLWELKVKPEGSNTTINDDRLVNAYLNPDVAGTYEVLLTVTNSENQLTATAVLSITAEEVLTNSAPVAVISKPLSSYSPNQLIKLNASASYDSDNDPLTYQWTLELPTGPHKSIFSDDTTEFVEFSADGVGEYQLTLTVSDGTLTSEATESIAIAEQNTIPIANAGDDQTSALGVVLELNGIQSSDAEGASLLYRWHLVSKPVTSDYSYQPGPDYSPSSSLQFVGDVTGVFVFALQVFDGIDYSQVDSVQVEVIENQRPIAILSDDIVINHSGPVAVQTTDSYDPEDRPLTYQWSLLAVPDGSAGKVLSNDDFSDFAFLVDEPGTYTIQLVVNDGIQDSLPATINYVYVEEPLFEVNVTGQLRDAGNIPLANIDVGGFFQASVKSDENGYFDVTLKSDKKDKALSLVKFKGDNILPTLLELDETDELRLDLGSVKLPVLQKRLLALSACPSYSGSEKVTLYFLLTQDGYASMHFFVPVEAEFSLGQEPIEVNLPATGVILMRVATTTTEKVYVENGDAFFTNQYQLDHAQSDTLMITICNQ